jgi:hypothetical protein
MALSLPGEEEERERGEGKGMDRWIDGETCQQAPNMRPCSSSSCLVLLLLLLTDSSHSATPDALPCKACFAALYWLQWWGLGTELGPLFRFLLLINDHAVLLLHRPDHLHLIIVIGLGERHLPAGSAPRRRSHPVSLGPYPASASCRPGRKSRFLCVHSSPDSLELLEDLEGRVGKRLAPPSSLPLASRICCCVS